MIGGGGAGSSKQSPPREGFLHCAGRQHQPQTLCSAKAGAPAISLLLVSAVAGPCPPSAGFLLCGVVMSNNRFVIVAVGVFEVETKAYFAQSRDEAEQTKAQAEAEHGVEFAIFAR